MPFASRQHNRKKFEKCSCKENQLSSRHSWMHRCPLDSGLCVRKPRENGDEGCDPRAVTWEQEASRSIHKSRLQKRRREPDPHADPYNTAAPRHPGQHSEWGRLPGVAAVCYDCVISILLCYFEWTVNKRRRRRKSPWEDRRRETWL